MPVTQNTNPFLLNAKRIFYFASGHNNISNDIKHKKWIFLFLSLVKSLLVQ